MVFQHLSKSRRWLRREGPHPFHKELATGVVIPTTWHKELATGVVIPTTWQMTANSKTKPAITAEYKVISKRSVRRRLLQPIGQSPERSESQKVRVPRGQSPSSQSMDCTQTVYGQSTTAEKPVKKMVEKAQPALVNKVDEVQLKTVKAKRDSQSTTAEKPVKKMVEKAQPALVNKVDEVQLKTVKAVHTVPQPVWPIKIDGTEIECEVDTGASDNFLTVEAWEKLGQPPLRKHSTRYESASKHVLPVRGSFIAKVEGRSPADIQFVVTEIPKLNLLGRDAITTLKISVDSLMGTGKADESSICSVFGKIPMDHSLQTTCQQICQEFPDVFKPELGCLKDFELEVKFKPDAQPTFCGARSAVTSLRRRNSQGS